MKYAGSLLLVFLLALSALAQTPVQGLRPVAGVQPSGSQAQAVHITDDLVTSPEGQAALRAFHEAKAAGRLPRPKAGAAPCTVGQARSFNVLENVISSNRRWVAKTFTCKASNTLASVWLENSQDTVVAQQDLDALAEALLSRTPEGSFNPNQGIIANDEQVFGLPPNYDGDGVVDVLLYDITEGPDAESGLFVLGFFSPTDITPGAPAGQGNQADVLYLDTNPLITDPGRFGRDETFVQLTAAHEYQHLIHANYDQLETTFVNEAQSEWAEYLNGYQGRFITYLNDVNEHNILFLRYEDASSLRDRQRGSLFHNYLAEQVGALTTGALTRDPGVGLTGYNNVLGAEEMRRLLADFHTANFLNNTAIDPRYGYARDKLQGVKAKAAVVVDGRSTFETPATTFNNLRQGGVRYLRWEDVGDFTLSLDAVSDGTFSVETMRTWLRPRVVLERTDGTVTVQSIAARAEAHAFTGPFAAVTLIVPHVELSAIAGPVNFRYAASWTPSGAGLTTASIVQDDGNLYVYDDNGNGWIFTTGAQAQGAVANRMEVPAGTVALDRVLIAPFFEDQFGGADGPRNVAVTVWADANGRPGAELFSLVQNLGTSYFPINFQTPCALTLQTSTAPCPISNFWEVDLSAYHSQLNDLPEVIWVGYKETGTDTNYMVIVPSRHPAESVSWVRLSNGNWAELWVLSLSSGASLRNTSIPIRAEFLVDTATPVEEMAEVPAAVVLEPNRPNPFNPVTTIAYRLDRPTEVRLAVYDVLGRRVATLVDGLRPAGRHEVVFDATGRASGLYVYRLETPAQVLTRTMVLLR
ncbi:T9SS type A sorting domain-containing protein [Rhodocaloribacter litoris]|uniref:T9SS type A sorting domain-containing protein n=1 Tax=Rhodocaloribacter litoris TaxID=2558931 RepID=UPI001E433A8D|nr:T9SS type A sorting domain-containing protein [Rhodocaloribacter litoris]QXD16622.1 T9SS type A sorting domain-containing protein [Rhodocaloribacter litoris]